MGQPSAEATDIKIAYIGGGSKNWARSVMTDLALCEHLTGQIALYDINYAAAEANVERGEKLFAHDDAKTHFAIEAFEDLGPALDGADFVFLSIQPGPVRMHANDLDIPAEYGIVQPVGDTVGPGGLSRALRAVPLYEHFAHQIMLHCPEAWAINYTNPMTVCTRALYAAEPDIQAFGCCHEVFGTQWLLAHLVEKYLDVERPDRREIHVDVAGVNHFTWVPRITWNGRDLYPLIEQEMSQPGFFDDKTDEAAQRKSDRNFFKSSNIIKYELYRRFGVFGAAGDRHLVEFVPWFARDEATLHRWGVVLTPSAFRLGQVKTPDQEKRLSEPDIPDKLHPTGEEGVEQICALVGAIDLDTNVNLPNRGQQPELGPDVVVESNAQFRRNRVTPVTSAPLPDPVVALVQRVVDVQEMTLTAAMDKDYDLALQALLCDPLVTISTDQADEMLRRLLEANREMMRGWEV